ncbi:MAG: LytTR family DNA-binding domain-containing protein [Erythrobacter sp.]
MIQLLARYHQMPILLRLSVIVFATVMGSGLYCLAYRYSAGNPATVPEAFSWGVINLTPWVIAIEIGRGMSNWRQVGVLLVCAGLVSLALGAAFVQQLPDVFELARRIPAIVLAVTTLVAIELYRNNRAAQKDISGRAPHSDPPAAHMDFDWARAAGNYVELYTTGSKPKLVRSTLSQWIDQSKDDWVRIHRSYAVERHNIANVDRSSVLLISGDRLPLGNAYRSKISAA